MKHLYDKLDMSRIIAKVLYLGMFLNVLLPGALLGACYYYDQQYPRHGEAGDMANFLFYIFATLALAQAGYAIWWRGKRYNQPMVKSQATMEDDLVSGLAAASKPIFVLVAAISGWGYLYFIITGRFKESLVLVLLSFVVFQIVRPRYSLMKKVIDRQIELLDKGKSAQ